MKGVFHISVCIFLLLPFYNAAAGSLFVEKWGSEDSDCSRTEPCSEITTALNIASSNDRIFVGPGSYDGGLVIQQAGVRIESTAGPRVTTIDARRVGSGIIGVDVQADRVSIGRIGGRGFTILTTDAEVIRVGQASVVTECILDTVVIFNADTINIAREIRSDPISISNTRIEGNNLFQLVVGEPPLVGEFCRLDDFDNPTAAEKFDRRKLDAISVAGDGVILRENNVVGAGTQVLNLSQTIGRSTIQENNIKHDLSGLNELPAIFLLGTDDIQSNYLAVNVQGNRSIIRDNLVEVIDLGLNPNISSAGGIKSLGDRNQIISNIVLGFSFGIDSVPLEGVTTISRNIVINPQFVGISDFSILSVASITDNTIFSEPLVIANAAVGIVANHSRLVRGNNVSGFTGALSTGLEINQTFPTSFNTNINFTTVSNNNFYDLNIDIFQDIQNGGTVGGGRCGVFIANSDLQVRMTNNFFGSTVDIPQIIESETDFLLGIPQPSLVSNSWNICAANGLVENFNGAQQIANVTTRARNRPNPIRAIFRDNPF